MKAKHYLVSGHTAKGYINLFSTNLKPLDKLYILMGGPGTGKLNIMKKIALDLEEQEEAVEYIHSPSDPEAFEGILFPGLGVGIVDGTEPQWIELRAPGAIEEYIPLGSAWNTDLLASHTAQIIELKANIQQSYKKAYDEFAGGLKVHDEWEKIYIQNMDFAKADQLTADVISILIHDKKFDKTGCIKHRFFGGSTAYGPMDFVDNITDEISTRYFIKGRPGSGKSTMLKKILAAATAQGIDVEVYHCGFDPDSLDMLLFPELNLCIFDSTSPHEYYPSREGDVVIDMYAELITEGTDEFYTKELTDIVARYKSHTRAGTAHLAAAKGYLEELEKLYQDATDLDVIEKLGDDLIMKIKRIPSLRNA